MDTALVLGLSLLLFLATEFYFPESDSRKKHFWSIMLTIFSLTLGFVIRSAHQTQLAVDRGTRQTQQEIENVGTVFRRLTSLDIQQQFQSLFTLYDAHFDHAQPVLKGWAKASLDQLNKDMIRGYISLPREVAAAEIGKAYPYASRSIVATNVGGTKFYFSEATYIASNLAARDRGVPVIRFYLFSKAQKIQLRHDEGPKFHSIDEFRDEVIDLHYILGSAYSAVIDVDTHPLAEIRDVLLLDNNFLAESKISPAWELLGARASEDPDRLQEVRDYFRQLHGAIEERYVVKLSDVLIRKYFREYQGIRLTGDTVLADRLFHDVLQEIEGRL